MVFIMFWYGHFRSLYKRQNESRTLSKHYSVFLGNTNASYYKNVKDDGLVGKDPDGGNSHQSVKI